MHRANSVEAVRLCVRHEEVGDVTAGVLREEVGRVPGAVAGHHLKQPQEQDLGSLRPGLVRLGQSIQDEVHQSTLPR